MADLEPIEGLWTIRDVADHTGLKASSVRAYISMGEIPQPDFNLGYKPLWRQETILRWHANRNHGV